MKIGIVLIAALLCCSCAVNQSTVQIDGNGYLVLKGECEGVVLQIDDGKLIELDRYCDEMQFSVQPGRHIVKITRDGSLLVERIIIFNTNIKSEVLIP